MKHFLLSALFLCSISAAAQVGINTTSPDSTALLDIRFSGTGQIGVLLPNVDDDLRKSKKGSVSDGMVVFDRQRKMLYYYDEGLNEWIAMTPFGAKHDDSKLNDIRPQGSTVNTLNMSLGLPDSEKATAKLDVNGSVRVRDSLQVDGNLKVDSSVSVQKNLQVQGATTLQQTVQVNGNTTLGQSLTVGGNTTLQAALTVNSNISADTIRGTAVSGGVPVGAIVMWTGSSIPPCWEIVAEMTDRFPVGAGGSYGVRATSDNAGRSGANEVNLAMGQMPKHRHSLGTDWAGNEGSNADKINNQKAVYDGRYTNFEGGNSLLSEGQSEAHENRPPFYGIYFIKKTSNACPN